MALVEAPATAPAELPPLPAISLAEGERAPRAEVLGALPDGVGVATGAGGAGGGDAGVDAFGARIFGGGADTSGSGGVVGCGTCGSEGGDASGAFTIDAAEATGIEERRPRSRTAAARPLPQEGVDGVVESLGRSKRTAFFASSW